MQIQKYKYTHTKIQHMIKCQKDPTCSIFLKRGLFKDIKNDISMCQTCKYKNTKKHPYLRIETSLSRVYRSIETNPLFNQYGPSPLKINGQTTPKPLKTIDVNGQRTPKHSMMMVSSNLNIHIKGQGHSRERVCLHVRNSTF